MPKNQIELLAAHMNLRGDLFGAFEDAAQVQHAGSTEPTLRRKSARSSRGRVTRERRTETTMKKYNVTFEERRRPVVTVTAKSAEAARQLVETTHGAELEEKIATREIREAAYCAQQLEFVSVEHASDDLGGSLGYDGADHARRAT